jgi:hypothetical protein
MAKLLAERPRTFYELLRELEDVEYRAILQAWGDLRERRALGRDDHGRYLYMGGLATGPPSPPTLVTPRETRGAPRDTPAGT